MKPGLVIVSWIARHAFALVLIVLLLIVARQLAGPAGQWIGDQSRALRTVPAQQAAYADASRAFEVYAARRKAEAQATAAALPHAGEGQLRARLQSIGPEIARQAAGRQSTSALALAAARGDSEAVLAHYRAGAEIALLERERETIEALLSARSERLRLSEQRREAVEQLRASHARYQDARRRAERLQGRFMAEARNNFCRVSPLAVGCDNYRALVAARREMRTAADSNRAARARIAAIDGARRGLATAGATVQSVEAVLAGQRAALVGEAADLEEVVRESPALTAWRAVAEVLPTAITILLLAMVSPLLVKAALYYWVAPFAARRPPIRLLESDRGEVRVTARSAVSQRVPVEPGEELLAAPQAIQSTPHHAAKRTRWLLSWSMPFSSLASGMAALTAITVTRPDTVLVSATGGPLNEIALVRLEPGSAMVLRPRALRGLVQDKGEPVRITRRWRLGLSAWLTLQFRYLIFHGPCTLIVEGARGVRLENAGTGRGVNQAAMVGFSAGLAYAVARSETFGAYLMGKQALFNDSFRSEAGFHLHEEMPMEARKGGIWRGGLRGLGDAALKVVGL